MMQGAGLERPGEGEGLDLVPGEGEGLDLVPGEDEGLDLFPGDGEGLTRTREAWRGKTSFVAGSRR